MAGNNSWKETTFDVSDSGALKVRVGLYGRAGMSAATRARKVGAPEDPLGLARTSLAGWLARLANVSVPEVVTGLPVTLNRPVSSASPTEVTVPEPAPVLAMVMSLPTVVTDIPVPARISMAPVSPLTLETPEPPPPEGFVKTGYTAKKLLISS